MMKIAVLTFIALVFIAVTVQGKFRIFDFIFLTFIVNNCQFMN